jgi:hypothetical protein
MNTLLRLLWVLVLLAGATAAVLFVVQGGFGGGHGRFDQAIAILGFPWTLIPWPDALYKVAIVPLVFVPFVINVGLVGILTTIGRKIRSHGES